MSKASVHGRGRQHIQVQARELGDDDMLYALDGDGGV
jgi:hypothetical protein